MVDPLIINVNSYATPDEIKTFLAGIVVHAARQDWENLTNVDPTWQQSNILIYATQQLKELFTSQNLVYPVPPSTVLPFGLKEALCLQALYNLEKAAKNYERRQHLPAICADTIDKLQRNQLIQKPSRLQMTVITT